MAWVAVAWAAAWAADGVVWRWHGRRWHGRRRRRHGVAWAVWAAQSGTMPAMIGMMMLSRMIMYFCGDPESWDMRSLMIGMMGGMGGGMGGMGGGMMGGMGGGMGGMGGGMRSVPATDLPSALLNPGRREACRLGLVSINPPDPEAGLRLPEQGEAIELGDIARGRS